MHHAYNLNVLTFVCFLQLFKKKKDIYFYYNFVKDKLQKTDTEKRELKQNSTKNKTGHI